MIPALRGTHIRRSAAVIVAVVAGIIPAAAHADAITYTDGGNVWVSSPDGSVKKQLTTSATSATEGVRYFGPSQADNGKIAVIFGGGLGKSSSPAIQTLSASGKLEKTGVLQLQTCGAFGANPSAFGRTRIDPAGEVIAYDYLCTNTGQGGGGSAGTDVYTALTSAANPGGVILDELRATGGYLPSWLTRRNGAANDILASDQYGRWLGTLAWQTPLEWTPILNASEGYTLGGASFSRTGNILAFEISQDGSDTNSLVAARLSGEPTPDVQVLGECVVATSSEPMVPSVSPNGSRVAWSDGSGAKVAAVNVGSGADGQPCGGSTSTISATGQAPVFSGAASPTNGGGGGGGGGSSTGLSIKGPSKASRTQVRKGLTFSTKCSKKCTVKGTMTTGGKTVARATKKLKRKGTAKLVLKARLAVSVTEVTVVVSSAGKSATRTIPVSR